MLAARHALYQRARQRNPRRWSGPTRNWTPIAVVTLNPERDVPVRDAPSPLPLSSSIDGPAFPFFNRSSNCKPSFGKTSLFCSADGPLSCPGLQNPPASRTALVKTGRQATAKRRAAVLSKASTAQRSKRSGSVLPVMVLSAVWAQPQPGVGRLAPLCPERGHPMGAAAGKTGLPSLVPAGTSSRPFRGGTRRLKLRRS